MMNTININNLVSTHIRYAPRVANGVSGSVRTGRAWGHGPPTAETALEQTEAAAPLWPMPSVPTTALACLGHFAICLSDFLRRKDTVLLCRLAYGVSIAAKFFGRSRTIP